MATSFSVETRSRYAICVGINGYDAKDQILPLRFAEQDAKDVHALLLAHEFDPQHTCLLLGEAATWEAIQNALTTLLLTKARKDDLVLFYFAGHGVPISINDEDEDEGEEQEPQSDVFLCSTNFDLQKMVDERGAWLSYPLRMQKLRTDVFEAARSRKVLFIFDSCHSGDFFGKHYRPRTSENLATRYIEQPFGKDSRGRLVLSSCLPHQTSRENERLGHGVFTYHLLQALAGKDRQAISRSHEGWVTVGSLFDYLALKMPGNQRPVKSGAEHDAFRLVYYREYVEQPSLETHLPQEDTLARRRSSEKQQMLKAMFVDHSSFMRDRLESFVGRETELSEIRQRVQDQMPTGGYVTITGQAGQGKSSIIAQLVKDYIAEQGSDERIAYHFIPFNPGPDHQVGLLRNLIARLMFKHDLSDLYIEYVAYGNRPALRDFFPRLLHDIAEKGQHEIIFIDGLDQIEEDINGQRDLTFLPTEPPSGIVFVLGTRPNETLRPLTLHKPHLQYTLPNLSRADFDRILHHRGVSLTPDIIDQFYRVMQANALFLDLVAKELTVVRAGIAPEEMIKKLANNPANLFSFAVERLQLAPEWEIIEQVLGLLLASREPLSLPQLRQIIGTKEYRLRSAIARLGGLLTESMPMAQSEHRQYSLFHLMFQDYLGQSEHEPARDHLFATSEVEQYHSRLAQWCEGEQLSLIWQGTTEQVEQARRAYAHQHYITHLYLAKQWSRLFEVLDEGAYGRAKVQNDPSMRSYTLDLDLGRKAAGWERWSFDEGIALLPYLWRYTLLRCSLTSRANRYPEASFQLLVFLGREQEAFGLAELLTNERLKAHVLIKIARALEVRRKETESHRQGKENINLFMRAYEVACMIKDSNVKAEAFYELKAALIRAQQWVEAERVICTIEDRNVQAVLLHELGMVLTTVNQWAEAERVIRSIEDYYVKARALTDLGAVLMQAQQEEQAQIVWAEAEHVIHKIKDPYGHKDNYAQDRALNTLRMAKSQTQKWVETEIFILPFKGSEEQTTTLQEQEKTLRWAEIERFIHAMEDSEDRVEALEELGNTPAEELSELGIFLIQVQQEELARVVWTVAERIIRSVKSDIPNELSHGLGKKLMRTQQWVAAERVIHAISDDEERWQALVTLGIELVRVQRKDQAQVVWTEVRDIIHHTIEDDKERAEMLMTLGIVLTLTQQEEQAQAVWTEVADIIHHTIEDGKERAEMLMTLGIVLIQAQQEEQAQAVWTEVADIIHAIEDGEDQVEALVELGMVLIQAQQEEQAQAAWIDNAHANRSIIDGKRAKALVELGVVLVQVQQKELATVALTQANHIIHAIEDSDEKVEALVVLEVGLMQTQQEEQAQVVLTEAKEIIHAIEDSEKQAKALMALDVVSEDRAQQKNLAKAMWAEATDFIHSFEDDHKRSRFSFKQGIANEQAQTAPQEAERIIHTIEDSENRVEALVELGAELAAVNKHAQLLFLIQHSWQQANTEDYAIALLSLAYDFISLKPAIGIAFYEAFVWVNTFLEG